MKISVIYLVNGLPATCNLGICSSTDGTDLCSALRFPCGTPTTAAPTTAAPTTAAPTTAAPTTAAPTTAAPTTAPPTTAAPTTAVSTSAAPVKPGKLCNLRCVNRNLNGNYLSKFLFLIISKSFDDLNNSVFVFKY